MDRLSIHDWGLRPATKPSGMPTATANRIAVMASSTVALKRRPISSETGCWVWIDVPKSSWTTLPM